MDWPKFFEWVIIGATCFVVGFACDANVTGLRVRPNDLTPTGRLCPPTVVLIPSDSVWYILREKGTWTPAH